MTDSAAAPDTNHQAAQSDASSAPPPESGAQSAALPQGVESAAGVETPPAGDGAATVPGDAPPEVSQVTESQPAPEGAVTSALIETPAQGAAVEAGAPIPPADVEPVATPEAIPIEPIFEHPFVVLQRLRTKLAAYGDECVKAVQSELDYFHKLAGPLKNDELPK